MLHVEKESNKLSALQFSHVYKSFSSGQQKTQALADISLKVAVGHITALVGPDGAGKTTLLRLAAGLLLPDSGSISCFHLASDDTSGELNSLIGYMPQRFGLYEDLSVAENLNLYADLYGVSKVDRQMRFSELMAMTGLGKFNQRLAGQLSGGMKQKLGLACTLVNRPRLLLLDEPSVGVDPLSRRELWQIIKQLVQDNHTTVLLSTAYMDEAERCDQVLLLDQANIVMQGAPIDFKNLVEGCSYHLNSDVLTKRELHQRLVSLPNVIDAVVQGNGVRVVLQTHQQADWYSICRPEEKLQCELVPPRLEDAFIKLLLARRISLEQMPETNDKNLALATKKVSRSADAVIVVDAVDRWFGKFQAVKKLSFTVRAGEIFGLLGANGAGKTTTFRMLCGLLPPSNGQLRVAGLDLLKASAQARAHIGYMSQKFALYGQLSLRQNLEFFSAAYGLQKQQKQARIAWAISQFGLKDYVDADSADLPLGYKQRLSLACALMHEPEILFLDEPTSGIDPLARREFWARINQLANNGVTILVTTHFMEEAEYCDRLLIMREGDILAAGTPAEIKRLSQIQGQPPSANMEEAFINLLESQGASH